MKSELNRKSRSAGANPAPSTLVAFDTETHCVQPGLLAPPLVCISWAEESGGTAVETGRKATHQEAWELLCDPQLRLAGANAAYDMGVLMATFPGATKA